MFELDYLETSGTNSSIPWYARLWAAALRRAAVDFALYVDHDTMKLKKLGLDAQRWMFGTSEDDGVTSFPNICNLLNLPVDVVRERVLNLTEDEARRLRGMEFGDASDK